MSTPGIASAIPVSDQETNDTQLSDGSIARTLKQKL